MDEKSQNEIKCWKTKGVYGNLSCKELSEYIHCRNCPQFTKAGRELFNKNFVTNDLLDEWTVKNAIPKTNEQVGDISIVPFRLKDEWFALSTNLLIGANGVLSVHSLPHRSNNIFEGLVNINGELLCCVSAYEILGLTDKNFKDDSKGYKRMVIIKKNDDIFVFKVDELLRAERISSDDLKKPPATLTKSKASYTKNVYFKDEIEIGIINDDNFFKILKESLSQR